MKKFHSYKVCHERNTVIVTKAFMEKASQFNTTEFDLYRKFQEMGFIIEMKTKSARKKNNSPLRPLKKSDTEKKPLIPFVKMAQYISLLDDAEDMMDEFDDVRLCAQSQEHPRQYVNAWFRKQFPHYDEVPEFDEDNHIVHNPNVA